MVACDRKWQVDFNAFLIMRFVPGWRGRRIEMSILRADAAVTSCAAENWFYFVCLDGSWLVNQINFSHYPKTRQLIDILVEK